MEKQFCGQCGNRHDPQDRFCRYCGCSLGTLSSGKIPEAANNPDFGKSEALLFAEYCQREAKKKQISKEEPSYETEDIEETDLSQQNTAAHRNKLSSNLISAVMFGIAAKKLFG